mgnify:CR=1 FL=1
MKTIKQSDINHLRRLLGYVKCEIGGGDEQETIQRYAELSGIVDHELDEAAKQRIVESVRKAARVPQYIRRAVTALEKVVKESGDTVYAEALDKSTLICNASNRLKIKE